MKIPHADSTVIFAVKSEGIALRVVEAGFLNDLHLFDPPRMAWKELSQKTKGISPSPRRSMGFTADDKGKLYMFGGTNGPGVSSRVQIEAAPQPFFFLVFILNQLSYLLSRSFHLPADRFNDFYRFDPTSMAWTVLSKSIEDRPLPRGGVGLAWTRGKIFLHGGYTTAFGWSISCSSSSPFCQSNYLRAASAAGNFEAPQAQLEIIDIESIPQELLATCGSTILRPRPGRT